MVKVGVFSAQGAVTEHVYMLRKTFEEMDVQGKAILVKSREEAKEIDGIIIPGGESTTISRLLERTGVGEVVKRRAENGDIIVMGVCAGCIILAKSIEDGGEKVKSLALMDMKVRRNAFGRQRESFEVDLEVKGFSKPYHAVFIRAPIIEEVFGKCEPIAYFGDKIVAARQDKLLALCFHPELTEDTRIHRLFLSLHYGSQEDTQRY
ncbi:MAG: pyridoxal 5'-phosphate synthase glutaminase subunit PdxT [Thermoplasmata archaeon]|nr:MAG: pyridoxal 5'-phosphate synthase glutaminase subunit PdxT [Thermoplasmata archaeon]